jgi:hypothetical protein
MNRRSTITCCFSAVAVCALFATPALADSTPTWRRAPEGTFQLVELALARGVEDRKPVQVAGEGAAIAADGARVYLYLHLFNKGASKQLKVVWKRGEKVHHQATVSVGRSPSWRTWAYLDARPSLKGSWTVTVLESDGKELATRAFQIE